MKKILYFVTITALLFNLTACNDILDQMPNNSISGSGMWTTEAHVDQGVIGVYYSLQRPVQGGSLVGQDISIGYYGFEAFGMTGQGSYGMQNLFTTGVNPSNTRFAFTWRWCYDGIHRANLVLTNIENIDMSADKKAQYIAECKILRAFFYSRLNELFGNGGIGVPIYLEPILPNEYTKSQSSEAEVWAQIIQDLTDAINEPKLDNNRINKDGRVSKGTAYALRGRAYMFTKEYQKAADDFKSVGECGYALYSDYELLFKEKQERCEEMILSVEYIAEVGYGSMFQKFCAPHQAGSGDGTTCWTDIQISPTVVNLYEVVANDNTVKPFNWEDFFPQWNSLPIEDRKVFFIRDKTFQGTEVHSTITKAIDDQINGLGENAKSLYLPTGNEERIIKAYENRDPRLNYSVIVPYSKFRGVEKNRTYEYDYIFRWPVTGKHFANEIDAENNLREGMLPSLAANAQAKCMYMFRKFVGVGLEYKYRTDNPVDEPIIRYADVLLMWAEALVELNDLPGAKAKVEQVRNRVKMPTMASSFADQETARKYVRDERRRELIGEGVNFFDEMRWRTLKETKFDNNNSQMVWGGNAGGSYQWIGDQWYTWPVPKAEIEMNENLIKTPGWEY